jgi:hypothetical protein
VTFKEKTRDKEKTKRGIRKSRFGTNGSFSCDEESSLALLTKKKERAKRETKEYKKSEKKSKTKNKKQKKKQKVK